MRQCEVDSRPKYVSSRLKDDARSEDEDPRPNKTRKYDDDPHGDEKWRIAQRSLPRRIDTTSSSDCSCSSCASYRVRKEVIRRRRKRRTKHERERERRRRHSDNQSDSDQSGLIAARHGVVTHRYGKYGLISESDKHVKQQEFRLWLAGVKNKSPGELSLHDERRLFEEYVEDFNTATFPSKKYYNILAWEDQREEREVRARRGKYVAPGDRQKEIMGFDDEKLRRDELRQEREKGKKKELDEALENLKKDKEVVDAMRRQKALRMEMDYLFKTGKIDQARDIQTLLRSDARVTPELENDMLLEQIGAAGKDRRRHPDSDD